LKVAGDGTARQPVVVRGVKLSELRNKSLVLHGGGDNHSDQPKPNGGGGDRIACGVVQAGEKP
jgi:Cu-Zn family superoxide dismutase